MGDRYASFANSGPGRTLDHQMAPPADGRQDGSLAGIGVQHLERLAWVLLLVEALSDAALDAAVAELQNVVRMATPLARYDQVFALDQHDFVDGGF